MGLFDLIEDAFDRIEEIVVDDIPEAVEEATDKVADWLLWIDYK